MLHDDSFRDKLLNINGNNNQIANKGERIMDMECPICKCKTKVELDTHPDGFAENLEECGNCGALWTLKGEAQIMIHGSTIPVRA